jgi:hypothetical protein
VYYILYVLGMQPGLAHGRQIAFNLQRVMRRKLHDAPGNPRLRAQGFGQHAFHLKAQHIAGRGFEQFAGVIELDPRSRNFVDNWDNQKIKKNSERLAYPIGTL